MSGTHLLPRLDSPDAFTLRSRLLSNAREAGFSPDLLEEMFARPRSFPPSGGRRTTIEHLHMLRLACLDSLEHRRHSYEYSVAFDLALGHELSRDREFSPGEMGVAEVWDFLALVLLPDVVVARVAGPRPTSGRGAGDRRRLIGGDRRHVLRRLWRRRVVFGDDIVESRRLTEDDYVALLERRVTLERRNVARRAAEQIMSSGYEGSERREYTRIMMRHLTQVSGIVHLDDTASSHLDAVLGKIHTDTVSAMERRKDGPDGDSTARPYDPAQE